MQTDVGIGVADILMGIYLCGGHLQLVVKPVHFEAHFSQVIRYLIRWRQLASGMDF